MGKASEEIVGPRKRFDPEGDGYDYDSAREAGLEPGEDGHWPSREPRSGKILKGRKHSTYHKTEEGEAAAGYEIRKESDGRYYSSPKR